jgi:Mitochondrial K+-H+ exchange-related
MDVFLIPVGPDRYELYCETPDEDPSAASDHDRGFFRGLIRRFREMLASAERERQSEAAPDASSGLMARLKSRAMRMIAETIAEQRLLWHMRRQSAARLTYPADLDESRAMPIVRKTLQSDFEKHRWWFAVNCVLFAFGALLTLLPGPNLVAYYFAFRLVGHFLSLRGARQGLRGVAWTTVSSAPLAELRALATADRAERRPRVDQVAASLQLEHLTRFFDRVA